MTLADARQIAADALARVPRSVRASVTVVVEARSGSGSLITADFATSSGRDVGAVPGPVTSPLAEGTNSLIRDGAALIRDAGDVVEALGLPGHSVEWAAAAERDPTGRHVPTGVVHEQFGEQHPALHADRCTEVASKPLGPAADSETSATSGAQRPGRGTVWRRGTGRWARSAEPRRTR